ncbi:MAG TPA: Xaa-Pro peptidase family protein [Candidatus Acidoferrales bacterium]|nr:Xaa-Pro peptidase family protein [Candidatus Acidoferrales bacterium]
MGASSNRRLRRLRERIDAAGADAFLVTHIPNVFYLSGFTGDAGALVVERGRATLLTDSRFTIQAREELASTGIRLKIVKGPLAAAAAGELARRVRGRGRVAFEAARLPVADAARLRQAGGKLRWRPAVGWVERLRATKEPDEIVRMREAARLASRVVGELLPMLKPGVRECDVAAEIEFRMRRLGASGPAFETIVASGARGALPHARATTKVLRANELVVIDMGAILRGYCSDLTRTLYLGRASARVRRWYRAVLEAQAAARDALRPGVPAEAPDAAARKVLAGYGLDRAFVHSTGHGLGIEVHEEPRLGRGQSQPLDAASVVTIEPGVYLEGVGGIRIEDDVLVTPTGPETLTSAPRDFLEL